MANRRNSPFLLPLTRILVTCFPSASWAGPEATGGDSLHDAIVKFHDSFPAEFGNVSRNEADRLADEVERILLACERYRLENPSAPPEKLGEIEFVSARFLFVLRDRKADEWNQRKREGLIPAASNVQEFLSAYLGEVKTRGLGAKEKLPADHRFSSRIIRLLGEVTTVRLEHAEARKWFETFLEKYPKDPAVEQITLALAKSCLELGDYDRGLAIVDRAMKEFYTGRSYPYFSEVRWKLCHAKGDIDGMLRTIEAAETVYPLKMTNPSLGRAERDIYDLLLDYMGFRRGYALFARGDFEGARRTFQKHIDDLDAKALKLPAEKKALNPAAEVYKTRSQANLDFLHNCAGLPPPMDLELGDGWLGPKRLLLRESKGKVAAIVFRSVDDARAGPFLAQLSQFCRGRSDMEIATIAFLKPGQSPDEQKDQLQEDLAKIGYDGAAGFDPDVEGKKIFRAFHVKVGSATFIVVNKRGELVWFMEDPKAIDVHFAEVLLERIAAQS